MIAARLNGRPRKVLGWRSPEAYDGLSHPLSAHEPIDPRESAPWLLACRHSVGAGVGMSTKITVTRSPELRGRHGSYDVAIDNNHVGALARGESLTHEVAAGRAHRAGDSR